MADSSIRPGERGLRGAFFNYLLPAIIGALVALFFFHFVPEMMSQLYSKRGWERALQEAVRNLFLPYINAFRHGSSITPALVGWPLLGAVCGIYLGRLYSRH